MGYRCGFCRDNDHSKHREKGTCRVATLSDPPQLCTCEARPTLVYVVTRRYFVGGDHTAQAVSIEGVFFREEDAVELLKKGREWARKQPEMEQQRFSLVEHELKGAPETCAPPDNNSESKEKG